MVAWKRVKGIFCGVSALFKLSLETVKSRSGTFHACKLRRLLTDRNIYCAFMANLKTQKFAEFAQCPQSKAPVRYFVGGTNLDSGEPEHFYYLTYHIGICINVHYLFVRFLGSDYVTEFLKRHF